MDSGRYRCCWSCDQAGLVDSGDHFSDSVGFGTWIVPESDSAELVGDWMVGALGTHVVSSSSSVLVLAGLVGALGTHGVSSSSSVLVLAGLVGALGSHGVGRKAVHLVVVPTFVGLNGVFGDG